MTINTARRTMWIWVGVTLLAAFGVFAPSLFGLDGFDGGFALSLVSLLIFLTGIVVVFMYRSRAQAVDRMLNHDNILAHWKYTPAEWAAFTEKAFANDTSAKWKLFSLVMVITAVVCAFFALFVPDSGLIMLWIFGGLAMILAVTILFTTRYELWQNRRYLGEAIVCRDGVYINRNLHWWRGWGARLDGVEYNPKEKMLAFTYSAISRTGRNYYTVYVPVPSGAEAGAEQILGAFDTAVAN